MNEEQTIARSPAHTTELTYEGVPVSPGIAIGRAYVLDSQGEPELDDRTLDEAEIEAELRRYEAAVDTVDKSLEEIEAMTREEVTDRAEIFEALRMMLRDPVLNGAITGHIRDKGSSAHAAIVQEMTRLADRFGKAKDETMKSRAEDMRSLQAHLIAGLSSCGVPHYIHPGTILVQKMLSPGDAVIYARSNAGAFILETGGINSHAAILSRAFSVPMVAGIRSICASVHTGDMIIVDGYTGRVIVHPDEKTIGHYTTRKNALEQQREKMRAIRDLPAETRDGERILLAANIDMVDEIEGAIENGAEEIGLMRTEYLAMGRVGRISMEEQLEQYRQTAERAYPLQVTLRLFDIGSDKLAGSAWGASTSPLGLRGMRLLLERPELMRQQLEAALRASTMKNLRLMLPMVCSVEEIRAVKRITEEIREKLRREHIPFDEHMPLGMMVETPAAALTAESLAGESSFLSLGTNDLAQYTLAVDRGDEEMAKYYDEFHPAVLQLIRTSVLAAQRAGVPITICGEMAANPLATGVLVGLGLRRFSVSPPHIGPLKMRVRSFTAQEARSWARAALRLPTAADVRAFLAFCSDGGDSDYNVQ